MILNRHVLIEDTGDRKRTATVSKISKNGTKKSVCRLRILAHWDFESGDLGSF